jgi:hypothetical protein
MDGIESGLGWVVPSIEKKMAILLRPFKSHKCKSNWDSWA